MTFEEFFKKKKISLTLLQQGDPGMFMEFKSHYEQMGEKSFDHTKKYLFNPLRHKFPAPPEVKAEKVIIENQLAEQTITDTLLEPAPSPGFKPRFKAAIIAKPADGQPATAEGKPVETNAAPAPSPGFKPRFKAAMVAKPAEGQPTPEAEQPTAIPENPAGTTAPAAPVGFKPRFKAAMAAKPAEEKPEEPAAPTAPPEDKKEEPAPEETTPKPVGFKPRFNMNKMKPKE